MNDFVYITPEEAASIEAHSGKTDVAYYRKLVASGGVCENCDNPVWRFAGTGLCFTCTTGESDSSEDYELI
jgi:hypothetical protein